MKAMQFRFVDHIVLIVKNLEVSERFYSAFLGKPSHEDKYSAMYQIGDTKLFLGLPYQKLKRKHFDKEELGLNHLAFGVRKLADLKMLERQLRNVQIKNSGIQVDPYGKKPFIWFDDPDSIRLEFYLRAK